MRWIREHRVFSTVVAILVVLVMIIIISFTSGGGGSVISEGFRNVVAAVEKPFVSVAGSIRENVTGMFSYRSLQEENEKLQEEIAELKESNDNLAMSRSEYEELKELADAFNFEPYKGREDAVAADVIAVDNSLIYSTFTINAGTADGVEKGSTVVDGNGLVGQVVEAGKNTSKVRSVLNESKNISFMVKNRKNVTGVLHGDGNSHMEGYLIDSKATIAEGDFLLTSGMGNFPKGIPVGRVEKVQFDDNSQLKRITVRPAASMNTLDKVAVFR